MTKVLVNKEASQGTTFNNLVEGEFFLYSQSLYVKIKEVMLYNKDNQEYYERNCTRMFSYAPYGCKDKTFTHGTLGKFSHDTKVIRVKTLHISWEC